MSKRFNMHKSPSLFRYTPQFFEVEFVNVTRLVPAFDEQLNETVYINETIRRLQPTNLRLNTTYVNALYVVGLSLIHI